MDKKFWGTGVALVTPFEDNGNIDRTALTRILQYVISEGVDYLVIQGTTGESVTINEEEKKEILTIVQEYRSDKPVVFGIGGNDTDKILKQIDATPRDQYDAILSVCPYYNKPTQKGLIAHFNRIADHAPHPLILYNVSGRTGINMSAGTTIELSAHPNIIGIKEASGDFAQCLAIRKHAEKDFMLISGDDLMALPLMSIGAAGVISVIANALPAQLSSMINRALEGKYKAAEQILLDLSEMIQLMFREGNPAGVKGLMEIKGLCRRNVRLPLVEASDILMADLQKALKDIR